MTAAVRSAGPYRTADFPQLSLRYCTWGEAQITALSLISTRQKMKTGREMREQKRAIRKISYLHSPVLECTLLEKNYIYSQWSIQELNFNSIKASLPVGHAFVAVIVSLCFSDSSSLNMNRAVAQTFSRARGNILIQPHKRERKLWQRRR